MSSERERKYLMHRKILALCAALVALGALALAPAMAAAATLKDTVSGVDTTIPVGAKIKAISEETSVFSIGEFNLECNENFMTASVVKNDGTNFEATIEDARFQGPESETKCKSGLGAVKVTIPALTNEGGNGHWCLKNVVGEDKVEVFGRSCGGTGPGTFTFIMHAPLGVTCVYKREAVINGTYTTDGGTHVAGTLSVTGNPEFVVDGSNFFCPTGTPKITTMKFKTYTDNGTVTNEWDDAASTAAPVYVKSGA
jgi:hypothetical protein